MSSQWYDEETVRLINGVTCRTYLDPYEARGIDIEPSCFESMNDLRFVRVLGLMDFWRGTENLSFDTIMGDVINGLVRYEETFAYIIVSDGSEVTLYLGTSADSSEMLRNSLNASYPGIQLKDDSPSTYLSAFCGHGGLITGYPTNKTSGDDARLQIENMFRGFAGSSWVYMILAKALSPIQVSLVHEKLLSEQHRINSFVKSSITGGALRNQTIETVNFHCQNLFDNVKLLTEKVSIGRSRGMWRVGAYYLSPDSGTARKLRNMIRSTYSGRDSQPDIIRGIPVGQMRTIFPRIGLVSDICEESHYHPAGVWQEDGREVDCFKYKFQTVMTSDDLSTFCQIPRKEVPGYFIDDYVEFDVAKRGISEGNEMLSIGSIWTGTKMEGGNTESGTYSIDIDDLTRHGLIIGITGGGKTNTSKNLLQELWVKHKRPFLVVESAKREYWQLMNMDGFEDLLIFTLGSEEENKSIPFRLNPFEVINGVSLQTHIDYLLSAFKASFDLLPPMPYVLETCVYEVYADRGWDVLNNVNTYERSDYPTLSDLYYKVEVVSDRLGYGGEVQSNVKAALKARINSLRIGGKGAMLDTPKSLSLDSILSKPTVFELEDLGDDDVKAFVTGMILVQLYEYRKAEGSSNKGLVHAILIEEAHRLLRNVSPAGEAANPRGKAVEFFCNLLAEIRSYGQGILIADQIPTKLAPDTLKNTNLKIIHRTVMQEDREAVGRSMNMTQPQIDHLSSLKRGFAAVYSEGDNRPKMVHMPLVKSRGSLKRDEVILRIRERWPGASGSGLAQYGPVCGYCRQRCKYREQVLRWVKEGVLHPNEYMSRLEKSGFNSEYMMKVINVLWNVIRKPGMSFDIDEMLCILNDSLVRAKLSESYRRDAVVRFLRQYYEDGKKRG